MDEGVWVNVPHLWKSILNEVHLLTKCDDSRWCDVVTVKTEVSRTDVSSNDSIVKQGLISYHGS